MRYVAITRIGHPYLIVGFLCNFRLWYVVVRVDTFWYDSLRLGAVWSRLANFWCHGLPRPVLSFRYYYIRSDRSVPIESTMGRVPISYDHHDRRSRFGTMWHPHLYIRSDAFMSNRYALLWGPDVFHDYHDLSYDWNRRVYIQPDWLSTSLFLSISSTKLTFQPIILDNDRRSGWLGHCLDMFYLSSTRGIL